MREVFRWGVVILLGVHGLIHLLGAAKGFGWAEVTALKQSIGLALGFVWLTAGVVVITTGVLIGAGWRWWWIFGAVAVALSQIAIVTSWDDAKAGTAVNVVLLVAVVYGFVSDGLSSNRLETRHHIGFSVVSPGIDPAGRSGRSSR